ncbi:MAG: hypothetical protein KAR38_01745, partial [Calditrichia bacterium]|nr:hypothetical protein [Calditrichia bacterium]
PLFKSVIDFFILIISFCIVFWFKKGHFEFDPIYMNYFGLYIVTWIIANVITRKYKTIKSEIFLNILKPYLVAIIIMVGMLSLFAYGLKWFALSRFVVFGSLGIFFIVEMAFIAVIYILPYLLGKEKKSLQLSAVFFVLDIILITVTYLILYFYKHGNLLLSDDYKILMFIIYFSWLFVGLFTHKFQIYSRNGIVKALWPFVKSFIFVLTLLSFFVFAFRVIEFSRLILFGSIILFAVFEWTIVTIYYLYSHPDKTDEIQTDYFHIHELLDVSKEEKVEKVDEVEKEEKLVIKEGKYNLPYFEHYSSALADSLKNIYLKSFKEIYTFIKETLNLGTFDLSHSVILRSGDPYNVEVLPENSLDLFINLHEVNDFRRVNEYFIEVNRVLKDNSVFIGKLEPISRRLQRFRKKYPNYLANIIYLLDFAWR